MAVDDPLFVARFWARVDVRGPRECWEWTAGKRDFGYGLVHIPGQRSPVGAHRIAYTLAVGPIPEGAWVLHSCDNPPCVNPAHLRLGDQRANEADKDARGRRPTGVKDHPCRKCGGPREGRARRKDRGTEFAYCIPCKREYLREYHRTRKRVRQ